MRYMAKADYDNYKTPLPCNDTRNTTCTNIFSTNHIISTRIA